MNNSIRYYFGKSLKKWEVTKLTLISVFMLAFASPMEVNGWMILTYGIVVISVTSITSIIINAKSFYQILLFAPVIVGAILYYLLTNYPSLKALIYHLLLGSILISVNIMIGSSISKNEK